MNKLIAAAIALTVIGAVAAQAYPHHRHRVCVWHQHHRLCHWR
jgi:hypothetical protein